MADQVCVDGCWSHLVPYSKPFTLDHLVIGTAVSFVPFQENSLQYYVTGRRLFRVRQYPL